MRCALHSQLSGEDHHVCIAPEPKFWQYSARRRRIGGGGLTGRTSKRSTHCYRAYTPSRNCLLGMLLRSTAVPRRGVPRVPRMFKSTRKKKRSALAAETPIVFAQDVQESDLLASCHYLNTIASEPTKPKNAKPKFEETLLQPHGPTPVQTWYQTEICKPKFDFGVLLHLSFLNIIAFTPISPPLAKKVKAWSVL